MSHLGIGVMLGMLGGNEETVKAVKSSLNKVIESVALIENELVFEFEDGTKLKLWDDGQCCCESRYMDTDDDLTEYAGSRLLDFELKSADCVDSEYEVHEVQFLDVKTDKGVFTMSNHNEHNGYYGGFWIVAAN